MLHPPPHPSGSAAHLLPRGEKGELSDTLALYVHWPYCARICPYCDFNVVRDRGRVEEQAGLVQAILADMEAQSLLVGPRRLASIFFGGGTPSLMPPEAVAAVISRARSLFPPDAEIEITLEANPTDAEAGRYAALAEAGINRLSMGVQSFDDAALTFLGRDHSAAEARRAVQTAGEAFPRLSIDLIYARPGQSVADWTAELTTALDLGFEHISPYQLTIEPTTAFGRAFARGTLTPPDEDLAASLYEATQEVLEAAGFEAYEVSNHARDIVGDAAMGDGGGALALERQSSVGAGTETQIVAAAPDVQVVAGPRRHVAGVVGHLIGLEPRGLEHVLRGLIEGRRQVLVRRGQGSAR